MLYLSSRQLKFKKWLFCNPYPGHFGLWPLGIWFYYYRSSWITGTYGIGFHFLWIADAHIEVMQ